MTGRSSMAGAAAALILAVVLSGGVLGGAPSAGAAARKSTKPVQVVGMPAPAGTGTLQAVACGSATACWAVGSDGSAASGGAGEANVVVVDATTDAGTTWRAERVSVSQPLDLSSLSCPDAHHCLAVGSAEAPSGPVGVTLTTTDGGRRWHLGGGLAGAIEVSAVQCQTATNCLAIATDGTNYWAASTPDGGLTWQRLGTLPAGFAGVTGLYCPATGPCLAAGYTASAPGKGSGAVAFSTTQGASWQAAPVPAGLGLLHGVSCLTATACVAVGTSSTTVTDVADAPPDTVASTDGGQTWVAGTVPAPVDDAFGVACPSRHSCAVVGTAWSGRPAEPLGGVATSVDGATTWRPATARYLAAGLIAVVCPSARRCVAVGNDVVASVALPAPPQPSRKR